MVEEDGLSSDDLALAAYENFHGLPEGSATLSQVIHSAAGIEGWARHATYSMLPASSCAELAVSDAARGSLEVTCVQSEE